ncbi:MAG: hypothetical protein DRG63_05530 [Deltaproteobacteria bacterium]|nr:MAG: hypothetical protein DRG63_05530 [Deltaproteobacteria bacterium]RLB24362.1 MAG: hypothetical protein DRG76_01610 [Deltaproteobacteria bacterium]
MIPSLHILTWLLRVLLVSIFAASACAPLKPKQTPGPIPRDQVALLTQNLTEQRSRVHTFISSGRLSLEMDQQTISAQFFCIASRNPLRLKAEVTHSWGKPLVHFLIQAGTVTVVDLYRKKAYVGSLKGMPPLFGISTPMDAGLLWSIMRGYPELPLKSNPLWSTHRQCLLVLRRGSVAQEIRFDNQGIHPSLVVYPSTHLRVRFSDFAKNQGLFYARKVEILNDIGAERLRLKIKEIIFNQALPPDLFQVKIPFGFSVQEGQ